jgi:hypothetical protein
VLRFATGAFSSRLVQCWSALIVDGSSLQNRGKVPPPLRGAEVLISPAELGESDLTYPSKAAPSFWSRENTFLSAQGNRSGGDLGWPSPSFRPKSRHTHAQRHESQLARPQQCALQNQYHLGSSVWKFGGCTLRVSRARKSSVLIRSTVIDKIDNSDCF